MLASLRRTSAHLVHILYTELSTALSRLPPLPWVPLALSMHPACLHRNRSARLPPRRARYQEASRLAHAARPRTVNRECLSRMGRAGVAHLPWKNLVPGDASTRIRPSSDDLEELRERANQAAHVYGVHFIMSDCGADARGEVGRLPHSMLPRHRLHHIHHLRSNFDAHAHRAHPIEKRGRYFAAHNNWFV